MKPTLEKKLTELAREFNFREIRVQTEDRRELFLRFEGGHCLGCWDSTMPEDAKAKMEMMLVRSIIDRRVDEGWLLGYHHEYRDGFVYTYMDGLYAARAEQEAA